MKQNLQKNYWVVRMGQGNKYAKDGRENDIVAVGWNELDLDLSNYRSLDRRAFAEEVGKLLKKVYTNSSDRYIFSTVGQLHKFLSLIKEGDVVITPDKNRQYNIGEISGDYYYADPDDIIPYRHRRNIKWLKTVDKKDVSKSLAGSLGAIMTTFNVSKHSDEIETILASDTGYLKPVYVEDVKGFGLEANLEDFLVYSWRKTSLGKIYDIYNEDTENDGQQFVTDVGRIDILAKSKNGKTWLVIELKKGRTSDRVVGQLLRYMGYVREHLSREEEDVRGLIIAGEENERIRYAMKDLENVEFMTYKVDFKLVKHKYKKAR